MDQVLFRIPFPGVADGIPIFGFATMLLTAFAVCTWLACRRGARAGIAPERIQDLVMWLFVGGIAGARIVYMVQYHRPWYEFFQIWQGGIVFYGSAAGGILAYLLAHRFILRKYNISTWKLGDVLAPSIALGLCIGRVGCFLNGCCFGHVCEVEWRAAHFPMMTFPGREMLLQERPGDRGLPFQTVAGFSVGDNPGPPTVAAVDPTSPAAAVLRPGDVITAVNGQAVNSYNDRVTEVDPETKRTVDVLARDSLVGILLEYWPRGQRGLTLTVRRKDESGREQSVDAAYLPRTRGLHPTQVYESVSMFLLFWVLIFFYPLRMHDGQVLTLLMGGYAVHRFLNEMLRDDTWPVALGMTLSQNGSILVLLAAIGLEIYLTRTQKPLGEPNPLLQSAV
jgi:phosphatidylglycerol:prolipoprotein diacylglycerol transferase